MSVSIPLPVDVPSYTIRVTLGESDFILAMEWNERAERWYLSISDIDEVLILSRAKVVPDMPLMRRINDPRRPAGDLYAIDTSGLGQPPAYLWGDRWALIFVPDA